ncbi:MAG: methylated-DNA--[protein]-cysteine S-methyltransferase [Desulfobulbaceae bacterium]|nr:methylated-DNA--[protein]-cysteine S-methyltransferase [Desulfobulbaceae bacterium]
MLYSTIITTPLGTLRISADEQGLVEIILPGDHAVIPATMSSAESPTNAFLDLAGQQIREYCAGERREFDLPLSITGTRFQQQVWDIIRRVPYAGTMSYGEIARLLGNVGKARAVGGAAHANPLPLVIPCHRIIGADGSLTGFGGGVDLKKRLLDLEQRFAGK